MLVWECGQPWYDCIQSMILHSPGTNSGTITRESCNHKDGNRSLPNGNKSTNCKWEFIHFLRYLHNMNVWQSFLHLSTSHLLGKMNVLCMFVPFFPQSFFTPMSSESLLPTCSNLSPTLSCPLVCAMPPGVSVLMKMPDWPSVRRCTRLNPRLSDRCGFSSTIRNTPVWNRKKEVIKKNLKKLLNCAASLEYWDNFLNQFHEINC